MDLYAVVWGASAVSAIAGVWKRTKTATAASRNIVVGLSEKHGYKAVMYNSVVYPPFMKPAVLDELRARSSLQPSDIVIATFPKCGTTWCQQIVLTLLAGGDGCKVRDPMKMSPWSEMVACRADSVDAWLAWEPDAETQVASPARRVIKTHAPVHLAPFVGGVPKGLAGKVIVVGRNPKDCAVSLYHHSKDGAAFEYDGPWEHFLPELFMTGRVESGCYWQWQAGWWNASQAHPETILWVTYEELQENLEAGVRKIATFAGIDASPSVVARTVKASTFASMKKVKLQVDAEKTQRGERVKKNHLRKGQSGSWKKTFTAEQEALFDTHHAAQCAALGLPADLFDV